ncbi:substrate-binding periplasmic protein [Actinomadura sp. 6N118]|uniref:substrate-binding periplasmic protein n=1 Tax=Actinomadura sp. 6N118 TaxID=3375151 RepID=UPI0037A42D2D
MATGETGTSSSSGSAAQPSGSLGSPVYGHLYWLLPTILATAALTLWLLLNPKWGADVAAIVVIPLNVAAVIVPILIRASEQGALIPSRRRMLRFAILFTALAFAASVGVYLYTREPDPRDYLSGTVKVGVNLEDYPGWSTMRNNTRVGFDIALVEFLASHFKFTPEYIPLSLSERLGQLRGSRKGDVKLVVANFSMTPDREQSIDFAGPYFLDTQKFFTWDPVKRLEDIPPEKVCVPNGTTGHERLEKLGWKPIYEPSLAKCLNKFLSKADPDMAVSTDAAILEANAKAKGIDPPGSLSLGVEKYGIGIPNNRPKLCKKLNEAIEEFVLRQWDITFRAHLNGLSPDNRRPTSPAECKSPASFI